MALAVANRLAVATATCAAILLQCTGAVEDASACAQVGGEQGAGEESCLLQTPLQRDKNDSSGFRDRGVWWKKEALKILFVGNSFTYGPAPYLSLKQNNLPRFFKLVAESLGHKVHQQEDTIGGCSVLMHRPSINPQGLNCSSGDCEAVSTSHVGLGDGCTINPGISYWNDNAPCPQRLTKQDLGAWDVVALQDHSALPSVAGALSHLLAPSVSEYSQVLRQSGTYQEHRFGEPVLAMYTTWSYYDGMNHACPGDGGQPVCYPPNGTMNGFTTCETSSEWYDTVATHTCQAYSLARGYADMLKYGAKVLVPCGLAWEAARGSEPIPEECKAAIDAQFPDPGPLAKLNLPLKTSDKWARWRGAKAHELYRYMGPDYHSTYCDDGCHHDHHPSALGQYLNALVFFATLFKESPLGADRPRGQWVDGLKMPTIGEEAAKALQHVAHDVVLPHLDTWWSGSSTPQQAAPPAPRPVPQPLTREADGRLAGGKRGEKLGGFQPEKPVDGGYDI